MKKIYKKIGVFLLIIAFFIISIIPIKTVNADATGDYFSFTTTNNVGTYEYIISSFPIGGDNVCCYFNSTQWKWELHTVNTSIQKKLYIRQTERDYQTEPRVIDTQIIDCYTETVQGVTQITCFAYAICFKNNGFKVFQIIQNDGVRTLSFNTTEVYNYSSSIINDLNNKTVTVYASYNNVQHINDTSHSTNYEDNINYYLTQNQELKCVMYNGVHNQYSRSQLEQEYQNNLTKWVRTLFSSFNSFFDIRIGSVSIGAIVLIPLSISVAWFIIKNIRGGGA